MRRSSVIAALISTELLTFASGANRVHAFEITYLAPAGAPARAFPEPERPVAEIVSPSRSTERQRDAFNESGQLARLLAIRPGMTVGDIGAGSGYHTVRLSRLIGRGGRVIAQDVTQDYLNRLAKRIERLKLSNVGLALGESHDPRLPAASLDVAILVHMYHEVAQPYAFLYNLAPALKPGARVGIVDLDRPTSQHGTPLELLRCELAAVGYKQVALHQLAGDASYLAVFSPPTQADRKLPQNIVACKTAGG
jgi:SAM-dependent methyltransferase